MGLVISNKSLKLKKTMHPKKTNSNDIADKAELLNADIVKSK